MVFGQMNEPPGARMRVVLTGLTMAEYFRDELKQRRLALHRQYLPFHPSGFRSSALLPDAFCRVTNQPLASEMGAMQERITQLRMGPLLLIQAVYVPADDYTDPGAAITCST